MYKRLYDLDPYHYNTVQHRDAPVQPNPVEPSFRWESNGKGFLYKPLLVQERESSGPHQHQGIVIIIISILLIYLFDDLYLFYLLFCFGASSENLAPSYPQPSIFRKRQTSVSLEPPPMSNRRHHDEPHCNNDNNIQP